MSSTQSDRLFHARSVARQMALHVEILQQDFKKCRKDRTPIQTAIAVFLIRTAGFIELLAKRGDADPSQILKELVPLIPKQRTFGIGETFRTSAIEAVFAWTFETTERAGFYSARAGQVHAAFMAANPPWNENEPCFTSEIKGAMDLAIRDWGTDERVRDFLNDRDSRDTEAFRQFVEALRSGDYSRCMNHSDLQEVCREIEREIKEYRFQQIEAELELIEVHPESGSAIQFPVTRPNAGGSDSSADSRTRLPKNDHVTRFAKFLQLEWRKWKPSHGPCPSENSLAKQYLSDNPSCDLEPESLTRQLRRSEFKSIRPKKPVRG